MDFEREDISEEEIDDLGIKKRDNDEDEESSDDDSDSVVTDEESEESNIDEGIFGDDKELEDYMLAGYDDRD